MKVTNLSIHGIVVLFGAIVLLSNAGGVPQAVTKAPGEANHNSCATCHSPAGNYVPAIKLDVLKLDSTPVTLYNPGETYIVIVKVSATNSPKSFGFQMVCLDSLSNTDQGVWPQLGPGVKQQNLTVMQKQRKYLVQSTPRSDGTFTARWTAPATDKGKVKFYFAGLTINQNGNTNGDNNVFGQLTLNGPAVSATGDAPQTTARVFPNPSTDRIYTENVKEGEVTFVSAATGQSHSLTFTNGTIDMSTVPAGIYVAAIKDNQGKTHLIKKIVRL